MMISLTRPAFNGLVSQQFLETEIQFPAREPSFSEERRHAENHYSIRAVFSMNSPLPRRASLLATLPTDSENVIEIFDFRGVVLATLVVLSLLCVARAGVADEVAINPDVEFKPLKLDDPVTYMEMSDDGERLFLTHQAENAVTVYDVREDRVVTVLETPSPRNALWRNGQLIVADNLSGTISVFSEAKDWQLAKQFRIPKDSIVHLSAPQGKAFKNEIIVTCHGPGGQSSYQDSMIFVVSTKTGSFKPISKSALATVTYDGRFIVTQGSFNLSPSGGITGFDYREFVGGNRNARQIFRGGHSSTPFVYQVHAGGYLIGRSVVFGGVPLTLLEGEYGKLIIPDVTQKILYFVTEDIVQARKLNSTLSEVGTRAAQFPPNFDESEKLFHNWSHSRSYLLDHPVAATHDNQTTLFFRPAKGGIVLTAKTKSFVNLNRAGLRRRR